jgi:hypothetical protein
VLDTFKKPWDAEQKFEGVVRAAISQKADAKGMAGGHSS